MQQIEYSAASQLRRPRQFLSASVRSLLASRQVAWRMFLRSIRSQHRLSILGYLWLLIPAVAQILLWTFLNASNIVNTGPTEVPYVAFVIIGVFLWQGFLDGLNAPLKALGSAAQIISRVSFPVESLLIAGFAEALLNTLVRSVLLVPVLFWFHLHLGWTLLLAPLAILGLLLCGFAVGLVVAPFGMLYQDVGRVIPVVTQFLFLVTPIGYAFPKGGAAIRFDKLNPVSPLITVGRGWLSGGAAWPGAFFCAVYVGILCLLVAGWVLFRLSIPHLVDRVSS